MGSREIITLQIGHYSNFVGTHWWNIQESSFNYDPTKASEDKEVNHDILWREGQTLKGEITFTPRLIAFDLKGSLKTLKQEGILYDLNSQEEVKWGGDVNLHQSVPVPKNQFLQDLAAKENTVLVPEDVDQGEGDDIPDDISAKEEEVFGRKLYDLDDSVSVWSDFMKVHIHPKSLHIINEYTKDSEIDKFDIYGCGKSVLSNYETRSEMEDRIHFFTEECDSLQGFHILVDTYDGFGGLGTGLLEYLRDEFDSKSLMTFGLTPADLPDSAPHERANRILNSAITYNNCSTYSSLFTPLSLASTLWKKMGPLVKFPYLDYKSIPYHTSCILAAALDTMSLPYRNTGKKVASLNAALPFPMIGNGHLVQSILSLEDNLPWSSLTPHVTNQSNPFMQSVVSRGITDLRLKSPIPYSKTPNEYSSCYTVDDVLQKYLETKFQSTFSAGCVRRLHLDVLPPFPNIFSRNIDSNGFLSPVLRHHKQGVDRIPVMTSLQSSPDIHQLTQTLHTEASKLNIKKHSAYIEAGLEEDNYLEILQELSHLDSCYVNKMESL
ncbi:unnamed protein product [Mytilus coruscus]|uniref:Protein misato homolog 1 n=1 Tax=Mytilus coruscus TaxID=42192 RepID=A0A6J8D9E7_MYTCO|nr:unnamed protein product [Mytilus coruscus]